MIEEADKVLGLKIMESAKKIHKLKQESSDQYSAEVNMLKEARNLARTAKDWAKSDELRKKLEALGYEVKDTKDGTTITKK